LSKPNNDKLRKNGRLSIVPRRLGGGVLQVLQASFRSSSGKAIRECLSAIRVSATEGDQRFCSEQSRGDYQAALMLLAINIGYPTIGGQLLKLLSGRLSKEPGQTSCVRSI
jgi:hypothetical protein